MLTTIFENKIWSSTFKTDLKDYCNFIRDNDSGRQLSNVGGYQSNLLNLQEPVLQPLLHFIHKETLEYSKSFDLNCSDYTIDNMWLNINYYKDYNEPHIHFGAIFSGVYYVEVPENGGVIGFTRPDADIMEAMSVSHFVKKYNSLNTLNVGGPTATHSCFIFPGYYKHSVRPNMNKEHPRYSLSFNIIPKL